MKIKDIVNSRYSTKEFDPSKKISETNYEQIKALLRMCPSSINIQPWHFIVAQSDEGKKRIAKGTEGFFIFNKQKVLEASLVVVFCTRLDTNEQYKIKLIEKEEQDGRFPNDEIKQLVWGARNTFSDIHRNDLNDLKHWLEKQVYLNIGSFLLGVAALGLDALPMEGIDIQAIDAEFGLTEKGYTTTAVVAVGYRKDTDFNAPDKTPKSRLKEEDIFTIL